MQNSYQNRKSLGLGILIGIFGGVVASIIAAPAARNALVIGLEARAFEIGCNLGSRGRDSNRCTDLMFEFQDSLWEQVNYGK